jgi:hypothetical protein
MRIQIKGFWSGKFGRLSICFENYSTQERVFVYAELQRCEERLFAMLEIQRITVCLRCVDSSDDQFSLMANVLPCDTSALIGACKASELYLACLWEPSYSLNVFYAQGRRLLGWCQTCCLCEMFRYAKAPYYQRSMMTVDILMYHLLLPGIWAKA